MARIRVSIERHAVFFNEVEFEAPSVSEAVNRANDMLETMIFRGRGLELGMGAQDENPTAYVTVYSPKIADINEVIEGVTEPVEYVMNGRLVEVK